MRGKLEVKEFKSTATRIIPAHAGQTSTLGMTVVRPSDHPRACGANLFDSSSSTHAVGSSPRMRGKHLGADRFNQRGRIIPAHAEQTFPQLFCPVFCSDHPRACGANHGGRAAFHAIHGSSPRMRGKLGQIIKTETRNRIIPAHAGQTHGGVIVAVPSTDHPRACGANPNTVIPVTATAGSSPRMRGKPHLML